MTSQKKITHFMNELMIEIYIFCAWLIEICKWVKKQIIKSINQSIKLLRDNDTKLTQFQYFLSLFCSTHFTSESNRTQHTNT